MYGLLDVRLHLCRRVGNGYVVLRCPPVDTVNVHTCRGVSDGDFCAQLLC